MLFLFRSVYRSIHSKWISSMYLFIWLFIYYSSMSYRARKLQLRVELKMSSIYNISDKSYHRKMCVKYLIEHKVHIKSCKIYQNVTLQLFFMEKKNANVGCYHQWNAFYLIFFSISRKKLHMLAKSFHLKY